MIRLLVGTAALFAVWAHEGMYCSAAHAQSSEHIVLEVKDASADTTKTYELASLEALGLQMLATETPWTEGQVQFEGVLARKVLADAGTSATQIIATALNDYQVLIPVSDFENYDVILATRMNGQPMSVRDRGPIWVIYPWTSEPMLRDEVFFARSIWQLRSIQEQSD